MLQSKRIHNKSGQRTAASSRRYFFFNQATDKKSFKIHKMILLVLVVSLVLPMAVFAAAPVFTRSVYTFSVVENSATNTFVGQVSASGAISYAITAGNGTGGGAFTINSSGEIRVLDGTQLDYEMGPVPQFTLTVEATNSLNETGSATVEISIINVNDPPQMNQSLYEFSLDENQPNDTLVGQISATDPDSGDTLTYSILSSQSEFYIDSDDGEIRIADTSLIDFESGPTEYTLGVQVSDGGWTDKATVIVTINDTNDPPIANDDTATVDEDSGTTTLDVLVNDSTLPDTGETLSITAVGATNNGGTAVQNGSNIDYTPTTDFFGTEVFTYTVSDGNGGFDTATVTVTVNPINDPPTANDDSFTVAEDSGTTSLDVLANDSILPDTGETLSIDAVGATNNGGTAVINGSNIDYMPAAAFFGTEVFTYTISDGNGGFDTATVTVTVNSVNDPPTANDDSFTVAEDSGTTLLDVLANDSILPDTGETLSIDAVGATNNGGTAIINGSNIDYAPAADFFGTETFDYTISDGNGGTNTATVTITVNPVNDPPVANDDGPYATDEDTVLNILVLANGVLDNDTDIEGDSLQASPSNITSVMGAAVSMNTDGTFTYNPLNASAIQALDDGDTPQDSFTYTVSDGNGGTDTATVTINLTGVNDAPVAVADNYTINEGETLTANGNPPGVLGNDQDVDGDVLTAVKTSDPAVGTLSFNSDGTFTYTPPAPEFSGSVSFDYHVDDGTTTSADVTVTITVNPVNDPPVANDDGPYATDEDTVLNILVPANGVLDNDTDIEGDSLTASPSSITSAMGAAVAMNGDGTFSYNPTSAAAIQALDAGDTTTDTFTYTASDGNGGTDTATVSIDLTGVNDTPVATVDSYNTNEDTALNIAAPGVLSNDIDVDADDAHTLTAVLDSTTNNGTLNFNADGSFSYMPNANYNGSDSFIYHANDGDVNSNTVTVTINVVASNDAPTITEGVSVNVTMSEDGSPTAFSLTLNATDPDGNTLTWSIASGGQASNGTASASGTGTSKMINYTPNANYNGGDSFVVLVNDNNGGTDTIIVNVTINPVNDAPVAVNDSASTQPDTAVDINVLNNDTDVDNDSLTVTAVTQGSKGTVTHNGTTVTYTPNPNEAGSDTFTYTISDGNGGTDTATVTVQLGTYDIFLPMIMNNFVSAPDLVVTNINASSNLIEVTIENQGTVATSSGFWVDFYIDPDPAPTHENELWSDLSTEGLAWGVSVSIPAGGSLTLSYSTAPGASNLYYSAADSNYGGSLPVGTSVYAQVDSAHLSTTYGGVLETHEILGGTYNNVSSEYTAVATATSVVSVVPAVGFSGAQPLDLPLR